MDRELIEKEYVKFKKNTIIFSVLLGVSILIMLIGTFIFVTSIYQVAMDFETGVITQEAFLNEVFPRVLVFGLIMSVFSIASTASITLLIINAIKQGNRRRQLKQM